MNETGASTLNAAFDVDPEGMSLSRKTYVVFFAYFL